jgi:hypothetical protein
VVPAIVTLKKNVALSPHTPLPRVYLSPFNFTRRDATGH